MQTFQVLHDFAQNGKIHRQGDTVELSERQARYLLINGIVAMSEADESAAKASRQKPSPKAAKERRPARKKASKKAS